MIDSSEPPKTGKRARTRARLLEAAAKVFAAKGFYAATLDDVAAEAGLTKGAIYGNFKNKEELFLEVFKVPMAGVRPVLKAGASLKEQLHRLAEAVIEFLPTVEQRGVLASEYQRYVQTHPEFRAQVDAFYVQLVKQQADRMRPFFNEAELGMPLEQFLIIADALVDGLILQRFLTPSLVPDDLIIAAFERLAGG
ncbi:MAG: helix-turn-helix domain-containing protein [Alphaproteobacteria bacterium]